MRNKKITDYISGWYDLSFFGKLNAIFLHLKHYLWDGCDFYPMPKIIVSPEEINKPDPEIIRYEIWQRRCCTCFKYEIEVNTVYNWELIDPVMYAKPDRSLLKWKRVN